MPVDPKLVRDHFLAAAELPAAEQTGYLVAHCADPLCIPYFRRR